MRVYNPQKQEKKLVLKTTEIYYFFA
jgi:hypothetical protein